jgi:hypothetical protein
MTEAKHTPGPLLVLYGTKEIEIHFAASTTEKSAKTRMLRMTRTPENIKFLQTLAAAPDMLAALQMSLPALEWCQKQWAGSPQNGDGINVLSVVRAAIAKAEGGGR